MGEFLKYFIEAVKQTYRSIIVYSIFHGLLIYISIRISLKCVPRVPMNNRTGLVHVMAWHCTDNQPLPETMTTPLADAYMRY